MNPDGQRFHLLLGKADWFACAVPGDPSATLADVMAIEPPLRPAGAPAWDADNKQVTLALQLDRLRGSTSDVPLDLARRRAAAADAHGNIYWIGDDRGQLLVRNAGDGSVTAFWPDLRGSSAPQSLFSDAEPAFPTAPEWQGLAVTDDSWLVAAGPAGFHAFDLIAGGPPVYYRWPKGFEPEVTDLAARKTGLCLLDGKAGQLHTFDSAFGLCGMAEDPGEAELFQAADPGAKQRQAIVRRVATGFKLAPFTAGGSAIALSILSADVVAVLVRDPSAILVLNIRESALLDIQPLDMVPHDMAVGDVLLRSGSAARRLVVSGGTGNQLMTFRILGEPGAETLFATAETVPLRRYGGRALVSVKGRINYDTGAPRYYVNAVEQPRQLYAATGTILAGPFDAGIEQTIWDRIRIDGCIPPGCAVEIETCCGDTLDLMGQWVRQPSPVLSDSGSELAGHSASALVPTDRKILRGTFELLLQQMCGRYLQVRMVLRGDGNSSPHLRALRLTFPRVSWAERYLPAVWRAEPQAADFLERFLANMQGTVSGIEARIAVSQVLLDPRTVPAEAMEWLAGWFDVALDPSWGEARSRAFIAHALDFFGWRGTIRGIESALALAFGETLDATLFGTGSCTCDSAVRITETYRTRRPSNVDYAAGLAEQERWIAFQTQRAASGIGANVPMNALPRLGVPAANAADWGAFLERHSPERFAWQQLLQGRYRRIRPLNEAHGTQWRDFAEIALCAVPPATAAAKTDWATFAATLIPIHRAAHRFSVLLPVRPGEPTDSATLARREALARRIIALEKPAHTIFDVRFYFAANRVGEARLGFDTAIGAGSRAEELMPPALLGRAYAGESFISAGRPALPPGREVLAC